MHASDPVAFYCLVLNALLLFRHPSPSVLIPALRTVGNIVTGDDMQTQVLSPGMSLVVTLPFYVRDKENTDSMAYYLQYPFLFSFCFKHEQPCSYKLIIFPFFFLLLESYAHYHTYNFFCPLLMLIICFFCPSVML